MIGREVVVLSSTRGVVVELAIVRIIKVLVKQKANLIPYRECGFH